MIYITVTPQSELVFDCCGVSSIGTSGSCTGRISSYLAAVLVKALFCKSVGVRVSGTLQYGWFCMELLYEEILTMKIASCM